MLPEAEFRDWQRYAARRMLPTRRIELYLAQISLQVAKLAGMQNVSLEDFMFDPADVHGDDGNEPTAEEEAEFFDFKPRKRKGEPEE